METWNERLAAALDAANIRPYRLAQECGVTQSTVSTWLGAASKTPAADLGATKLIRVCEVLKVRPEWLMTGKQPMYASDEWPFEISRLQFLRLPPVEQRRVSRFMLDTWRTFTGEL